MSAATTLSTPVGSKTTCVLIEEEKIKSTTGLAINLTVMNIIMFNLLLQLFERWGLLFLLVLNYIVLLRSVISMWVHEKQTAASKAVTE